MTDFLTRLAAKSLGRAPVVQPRLLSRFETAPTVAAEPLEITSPAQASVGEHRVPSDLDSPVADERGRREWPDDHRPPQPPFAQPPRRDPPTYPKSVMIAHKVVGMTDRSADPVPLRADVSAAPKPGRPESLTEVPSPNAMAVAPTAAAEHAPAPHLSRDRAAVEDPVAGRVDAAKPTPAAALLPDPRLAVPHVEPDQTAVVHTSMAENISAQPPPLLPDPRLAVPRVEPDQMAVVRTGVAENISAQPPPFLPDPRLAVPHVEPDQAAVVRTSVAENISAQQPPLLPDPRFAIAHVGPNKSAALPEVAEGMGARSAPLVRVSIGRIEVRAVTVPAAPPRPRAAPRVAGPSLEEYLKERSGGS